MIIKPKIRGFICTTSHPQGCDYSVLKQIEYIQSQKPFGQPVNVLIIGASTGYGLASRIALAFGAKASTIGVFFEKPNIKNRTATAGWYNTAAFEKYAQQNGIYAKSINGDAFSHAIKQQVIDLIQRDLGSIDLLVYSLASPRRIDPDNGQIYSSTLKPLGQKYDSKTLNPLTSEVSNISLEPAVDDEITQTIAVMGGEDWQLWVAKLQKGTVLAQGFTTVAYTYIGPALTHPIYKDGTIGQAKDHLYQSAALIENRIKPLHGRAFISVNKALVTQASSAIPVVPLYMSILFKLMKEKGTHEGCIEQMYRLFADFIYAPHPKSLDDANRIRLDDLEMEQDIQQKINEIWDGVSSENIDQCADVSEYMAQFHHLFGFGWDAVNYDEDQNVAIKIPSIEIDSD